MRDMLLTLFNTCPATELNTYKMEETKQIEITISRTSPKKKLTKKRQEENTDEELEDEE
jgi:hypothetical protein